MDLCESNHPLILYGLQSHQISGRLSLALSTIIFWWRAMQFLPPFCLVVCCSSCFSVVIVQWMTSWLQCYEDSQFVFVYSTDLAMWSLHQIGWWRRQNGNWMELNWTDEVEQCTWFISTPLYQHAPKGGVWLLASNSSYSLAFITVHKLFHYWKPPLTLVFSSYVVLLSLQVNCILLH